MYLEVLPTLHIDEPTLQMTFGTNTSPLAGKEGKFLTANVLCENGIRYLVTAAELPLPEPLGKVDLAYTTANLIDATASSEAFQFWANENDIYTSFLIYSDQVEGEYTEKDMYSAAGNYIMFAEDGDTTFVDFLGFDMAITKEGQTYNLVADALGSDTIMYHITMSYTKPAPTDTIDIVATNMVIDEYEFWGMYFCEVSASNADYTVTLDMANGLPLNHPESGFDKTHPWKDRDPRFYKNYMFDGVKWKSTGGAGGTAELFTGGRESEEVNNKKGCYTGYMNTKWCPQLMNGSDGYKENNLAALSLMRLADVYLMYAEAVARGCQGGNMNTAVGYINAL